LIKIEPVDDSAPLDRAIQFISDYEWLIFTSVNGVDFFFKRLFDLQRDARDLHGLRIATVGPATSKRLFDFGLTGDIQPQDYRADSLVEAFADINIKAKKILLPRARDARSVLPAELTKMGAVVDDIAVYINTPDQENADLLLSRLEDSTIDLITFTSSSTAKNFKAMLPPDRFQELVGGVIIACIGPITAGTAEDLGFNVQVVAETSTITGLCDAIRRHYNVA
jgi:uroporphyrinogen III methyltransferase/synthase